MAEISANVQASAGRNLDKVSIWWDIENCAISMQHSHNISCNIKLALENIGFHGEVAIYVYGNSTSFVSLQRVLDSNGFRFIHVPPGKDAADFRMIVDMIVWAHKNPPPAAYLLISGDKDFLYTLQKLAKKKYKIMLAMQENSRFSTEVALTAVWNYKSLLSGGDPVVLQKVD